MAIKDSKENETNQASPSDSPKDINKTRKSKELSRDPEYDAIVMSSWANVCDNITAI